jgi:hypothetical protein
MHYKTCVIEWVNLDNKDSRVEEGERFKGLGFKGLRAFVLRAFVHP